LPGEGCHSFLIEAAQSEIDNQADVFNHLDNKTGVVLGFSLVAIVQLFGFTVRAGNPFVELPLIVSITALAATFCLLLATLLGVAARWPREFDDGWSVEELVESKQVTLRGLQDLH
jgi:hypothetical protein